MPIVLSGSTSGSTTLQATDAVTATLTLPSSTGTLLSTANPQSGGVIQVVNATYGTQTSTASASYVDTGLTATITPKFSTSKILVLVNIAGCFSGSATVGGWCIANGSNTTLFEFEGLTGYGLATSASYGEVGTNYLHSPATTSAYTYKVRFKNIAGTGITLNTVTSGVSTSTISLLEIAA